MKQNKLTISFITNRSLIQNPNQATLKLSSYSS